MFKDSCASCDVEALFFYCPYLEVMIQKGVCEYQVDIESRGVQSFSFSIVLGHTYNTLTLMISDELFKKIAGRAWWLTPVIPALCKAKVGGS